MIFALQKYRIHCSPYLEYS